MCSFRRSSSLPCCVATLEQEQVLDAKDDDVSSNEDIYHSELMAAQRDAERLCDAIRHREEIIASLTELRRRDKEMFEDSKRNMQAEMRMLQGMIQSLNLKLQKEKAKNRLERKESLKESSLKTCMNNTTPESIFLTEVAQ
jgi:hypothetical protein